MLRFVVPVIRSVRPIARTYFNASKSLNGYFKGFCTLNRPPPSPTCHGLNNQSLINNKQILDIANGISVVPVRTVIKFSLKKGKRQTEREVTRRFFRLHWGAWIRTKAGCHKRMWKKTEKRKRLLRQHVFCNATQSTLLDKMVTKFWKRPKYYVDDPYTPYHTREEFSITRKKPIVRD